METFLLIFVLFIGQSFYAQNDDNTNLNRYLEKSQRQKKAANILAITGGTLVISGFIVAGTADNTWLISGQELTGIGISMIGIISGITSIPVYISAHHNKKKSIKIAPQTGFIKIQETQFATAGIKFDF